MPRFDIHLYEDQYHDIVVMFVYVDLFERWCRYRQWLPKASVLAAPAEWWRYASRCVTYDLEQDRAKTSTSWTTLRERVRRWKEYIDAWRRKLGAPWVDSLDDDGVHRLHNLEEGLSVAEIIACRTKAEGRAAYERATLAAHVKLAKQSQQSPAADGNGGGGGRWAAVAESLLAPSSTKMDVAAVAAAATAAAAADGGAGGAGGERGGGRRCGSVSEKEGGKTRLQLGELTVRVVEARTARPRLVLHTLRSMRGECAGTRTLDGTKTDEPRWAEAFTFRCR